MKQQELADRIGINMQSLSKIWNVCGIIPTFDTIEKIIMCCVTNELLSGEFAYRPAEPYIM